MMKTTIKLLSLLFVAVLTFNGCSDDDDAPAPVNEEEVITTVTVTFSPQNGGIDVVLTSTDADGPDGPLAPVIDVSGNFNNNTIYDGSITFFNDIENEDITEEVAEEDDEHQVFFNVTNSVGTFAYADQDGDGNPLGLAFTFTSTPTNAVLTGNMTFTLRHEPDKNAPGVSDGDITNAGGETDIEVVFEVTTN